MLLSNLLLIASQRASTDFPRQHRRITHYFMIQEPMYFPFPDQYILRAVVEEILLPFDRCWANRDSSRIFSASRTGMCEKIMLLSQQQNQWYPFHLYDRKGIRSDFQNTLEPMETAREKVVM